LNFITYDCHLFWSGDNDPFQNVVLRSLPRVGEKLWFQHKREEDGEHDCNYLVEIEDIIHVGETEKTFACVQLGVSLIDELPLEVDEDIEDEVV